MTRAERVRLAFLTSTHVVDDLYQGAIPALLPFLALERHYSYTGLTGITLAATFLASVVQPGFGALTDSCSAIRGPAHAGTDRLAWPGEAAPPSSTTSWPAARSWCPGRLPPS